MTYDKIFSRFYNLMNDPSFFKLPQDFAYDRMRSWLHDAAATPYIRKKFSSLDLNDQVLELTYSLTDSIDLKSDDDFVISIFAQYMVIAWMKPQVENTINLARIIGGKEEKNIQANYKSNIERVDSLERKLRKFIRDYGYENNSYISGGETS
ncbi:MAG TPA: hypothetical protein DCW90_01245 [Lachnospiraceae bacterium]|nr:hypothetical protein [Lachnospiraceae bacterium]